ncbi:DUF4345 domain-containing protein [Pseudomonas sp. BMS12]|uniref:DUF4345 domain-containing protein n=1 Tax=Pseudomonas sp. BMS12 TaxID=1796033 RepID=UPI00083B0621|nr:DUF4345 domain-containing protein [Pseudomonas sp. BMS12]
MLSARIFLAVQALILAGFGLAYFVRPHELANLSGMLLMEPAAITDVRAYYGGLQLGLALWLLLGMLRSDLLRPALMLLVLLYSALFLARLGGFWLDGGAQQTFNLYAMLFEAVSAGLAFWLLRDLSRL